MELYNWNRMICLPQYNPNDVDMLIGTAVNEHIGPVQVNHLDYKDMKEKRFLFVGDSHMRGLAEVFLFHVRLNYPRRRDARKEVM